jgi:hypothetical protein
MRTGDSERQPVLLRQRRTAASRLVFVMASGGFLCLGAKPR